MNQMDLAADEGYDDGLAYIWQLKDWPLWHWDVPALAPLLAQVRYAQGCLLGRIAGMGFSLPEQALLSIVSQDVLQTSRIEGEQLNVEAVRSSVARRLGIDIGALRPADRLVDGVVDMVLDATAQFATPLTSERLFHWHTGLFPTSGHSFRTIEVGAWRKDTHGPMQVVSGPMGREKVHYQAPPATALKAEMKRFLLWFNAAPDVDPLLKAGLAHLWFVTLHPFDDGNGRIGRAVSDMALARAENSARRFYSVSAQIERERQNYYDLLERTQKGTLDVTAWLHWFLSVVSRAIDNAQISLAAIIDKAQFWQRWAGTALNERQIKIINRLLDGFEGKLTSSRWASIAKCSPDSALRDANDLITKGLMRKSDSGGRSTSYELIFG